MLAILRMQGGADFAYNIFYAGIWASSIDFGTDLGADPSTFGAGRNIADAEVDLVRRHRAHLEELALRRRDVQPRLYLLLLPGQPTFPDFIDGTNCNIDYLEGKAGYSVAWKQIKET